MKARMTMMLLCPREMSGRVRTTEPLGLKGSVLPAPPVTVAIISPWLPTDTYPESSLCHHSNIQTLLWKILQKRCGIELVIPWRPGSKL